MAVATAAKRTTAENLHQIGEVAELVGLSLRTVRYYEEVGLLSAPARTEGGFRLYGAEHIDQLLLIKQMKPLGFSIEEMRALFDAREVLASNTSARKRAEASKSLEGFAELASERCRDLRKQLRSAERFSRQIRSEAEGAD
ncbi:MAG TPA: MerR family transcriptional regulator [Solirubrobacterales bacterium]|nr:MerR family transcriptional regulator [Solirubrobacterales bacterium]